MEERTAACQSASPKCAVLVPLHKENPNELERKMFVHCLEVFKNRPVICIHPQGMLLHRYTELPGAEACRFHAFPSQNFASRIAYNDMLLEPWFYRAFLGYAYVLVHQLDSWVFEDRLDSFLEMELDYIGCAPAREGAKQDGGLSLRKTDSCMEVCRIAQSPDGISMLLQHRYMNLHDLLALVRRRLALPIGKKRPYRSEDSFFTFAAAICKDGFRVATTEQATRFGFCENPGWLYHKATRLPMGCHAPYRNGNADFWHLHIGISEQSAQ